MTNIFFHFGVRQRFISHCGQPWFDEGTRRKVHVLGKDSGPTLRTLIDPQDLPKVYGGELEWKFEDEPVLDGAIREVIGEMPKGPVVFEDSKVVRPSPPADSSRENGETISQSWGAASTRGL